MAKTPELDLRENYLQNYIINGDMQISQRGSSFASVADLQYTLDRYKYEKSGAAVHTISQDTDVPTLAQSGTLFQNSLRMNLTTPDTSIAATDYCAIEQFIEGYNWANLAQKPFTISFWVKATLPGIYCLTLVNADSSACHTSEYTINASGVWEKKSITITASPSAGGWNYTNGTGIRVLFMLASGSNFVGSNNTWTNSFLLSTANQVNGVNTGATDFRLTGIMLNSGTEAFPFQLAGKTFAGELQMCQRYYEKSYSLNTPPGSNTEVGALYGYSNAATSVRLTAFFAVTKRVVPTCHPYSTPGIIDKVRSDSSIDYGAFASNQGANSFAIQNSVATEVGIGMRCQWTADAEF